MRNFLFAWNVLNKERPQSSPVEVRMTSHQRSGQKLGNEHPIQRAAVKARQALNKLVNI